MSRISRCSTAPAVAIQLRISEFPEFRRSLGIAARVAASLFCMAVMTWWSSSSSMTKWLKPPEAMTATRLLLGHRSEEHTSELQSLAYLVCRLLLEKKKQTNE